MLVEIRIYRRHDADLIMLKSYGINISKMMRLALENYVEGERIKFRLPDSHACDISNCSMLRYRLNVKNPKVIKLLKSIKRGYRNQFCKALLRDMMDSIALGVYLDTDADISFENQRISSEAMVAETDLGLITNRQQLTIEGVFHEINKVSKEKEQVIVEENDRQHERDNEISLKFKDTSVKKESIFDELEMTDTTDTDNNDEEQRNDALFSMFTDMLGQ